MTPILRSLALLTALLAAACDDKKETAAPPPPATLTAQAVGYYCSMNLTEHPGPKGQIILRGREDKPFWFSSARDVVAFTLLDVGAPSIRAIYVSDMAKAPSWEAPGAGNWVEARRAHFVIGSRQRGGMGGEEVVPFSERTAAVRFAAEHGGRVVAFSEIPADWVLGDAGAAPGAEPEGAAPPANSPPNPPPPARHVH